MRQLLLCLAVAVAAFLLGFLPMWTQQRARAAERDDALRELAVVRLQNLLGTAAIDARRGDYEPARQLASRFFTELSLELERGRLSVFNATQRERLNPLLVQRDNLITLLARNDPASADRLSDLHVGWRQAVSDK